MSPRAQRQGRTNPAGSAIVNAIGQIVHSSVKSAKRYLVMVPGAAGNTGKPAQIHGHDRPQA